MAAPFVAHTRPELTADGTGNLAFLRITLIGKTGSGKSTLANAFVNNVFYPTYQPTKDLNLYYTILRIAGADDQPDFNVMLEIEDTWGSDVISGDKMEYVFNPFWPWPAKSPSTAGYDCEYRCGLTKATFENVSVHEANCQKRVGQELQERLVPKGAPKPLRTVLAPLSTCRPPEVAHGSDHRDAEGMRYRPLTRNRMAYLFVFDANDQVSYLEALHQQKALLEYLHKKDLKTWNPVVFLVANKVDKDPSDPTYQRIIQSLKVFSSFHSTPYAEVSALEYKGVKKLFRNVVSAVRMRQSLWMLQHADDNDDAKSPDRCGVQ